MSEVVYGFRNRTEKKTEVELLDRVCLPAICETLSSVPKPGKKNSWALQYIPDSLTSQDSRGMGGGWGRGTVGGGRRWLFEAKMGYTA